ncbi:MAG TPA: prolipoprotein diacylglyceryl transferase family protein [Geopsychrobacteraceae bacterium]|nr:prolipoprotein diacylglyceryl transferase family protein [Geopsychrobacteraceae bacterium]
MTNELFVLLLLFSCSLMMFWGFRVLPRDGWQMLATLPVRPLANGQWQGLNLTWYGLLTANAYLAALSVLIILLGAAAVPLPGVMLVALLMLALCVPASRLVARIVEGKSHTFTVGGAVFVGIVAAPWVVLLVSRLTGYQLPIMTTLAAIGVAYAFGEGLGRLACISFGCCYGKPVSRCTAVTHKIFSRWNFSFCGETRKIAYASGLEGEPVVPIQALTAMLYCGAGLLGTYLFLEGKPAMTFALMVLVTQGWRVLSETLRDDYRGDKSFSVYQVMGMLAIPYALICVFFFPTISGSMRLQSGLENIWQPGTLIFLQLIWLVLFTYTGRSTVTGANLSFHIHRDRI